MCNKIDARGLEGREWEWATGGGSVGTNQFSHLQTPLPTYLILPAILFLKLHSISKTGRLSWQTRRNSYSPGGGRDSYIGHIITWKTD